VRTCLWEKGSVVEISLFVSIQQSDFAEVLVVNAAFWFPCRTVCPLEKLDNITNGRVENL